MFRSGVLAFLGDLVGFAVGLGGLLDFRFL